MAADASGKPDPFTEEERDKILAQFKNKCPYYYPFAYTLFWTGMRPSETIALRWSGIDLRREVISITKSRYLDSKNSPKTSHSEREVRLLPTVADLLRLVKPLHVTEEDYIFNNQDGEPISFHTWRAKVWYRVLSDLLPENWTILKVSPPAIDLPPISGQVSALGSRLYSLLVR